MSREALPVPVERPLPLHLALPLVLGAVFLVAVVLDVPPEIRGPAPYPPEWQWFRRSGPWPESNRLLPVALGAAVLLALLAASDSAWARRKGRMARRALLATGTLAGWGFSLSLLGLEPSGALASVAGRVMSRTYTSYYTVAVSPEADDPQAFIERHATLLPSFQGWAKHAATHPPGPVLYYRGLIALCELSLIHI